MPCGMQLFGRSYDVKKKYWSGRRICFIVYGVCWVKKKINEKR